VVVKDGRSHFTGTPTELAETARGRVWIDDTKDPRAVAGWRVGAGHYHHVGEPPQGAELIDPAIEDAYLLMLGPQASSGMGEVA
jgi:ABC-2 type transport system ATP-binding protein